MATQNEVRWGAYDSIATYLTDALNSLSYSVTNNAIGAAIDFTAAGVDRKQFMDIEVYLNTVALSAQVNPALYVWLLARTDGTNFADGSATISPARPPDAIIPLKTVDTAQRVFARMILTTPDQGKILIGNRTSVAFNSSGNTLKYYTYGEEIYQP